MSALPLYPEAAFEWAKAAGHDDPSGFESFGLAGVVFGFTFYSHPGYGFVTTVGLISDPQSPAASRTGAVRAGNAAYGAHRWSTPHAPAECWICVEVEAAVLVHGAERGPMMSTAADVAERHLAGGRSEGPAGMVTAAALAAYNEAHGGVDARPDHRARSGRRR